MGKLSFARIFDTALIATTKSYQELQPFIEWIQNGFEMLYRNINGNLTIQHNLAAQMFQWSVKSSATLVTDTIGLKARPMGVVLFQQNPTTPLVMAFAWEPDQKGGGQVKITVQFASAPTSGVQLTVVAFFG
jgi:hypothetical protein